MSFKLCWCLNLDGVVVLHATLEVQGSVPRLYENFSFEILMIPLTGIIWIKYEGWGLSHGNYLFFFFGKIDRSWTNLEIYKWKRMVLGALWCMNNADFENKLVNDNIVLDVFIISQKLRHMQVIKIPYS